MDLRLTGASVLAVAALLAGCQDDTSGTAVRSPDSPTEPTVPTPRPSRTPTTAPPPRTVTPAPPSASPPAAAEVLAPQNGYVFVQTKSGKTRCQLSAEEVGCESQFTDAPQVNGLPANGVRLSADGRVEWVLGNLGDIPAVTLDYRRYSAVGWTIDAGSDGTRFSNDRTHRGMFVAVERVQTF
ncbi:hypothetical protein [Mycolicibacterium litorale]|uniref:Lipoprotein LpqJ n=1 Tax=Mycolicibacterium litorale TaxID=758802 RepID=A0AAD1IMA2_9MYCO|nr:hypothetical protein [Mycolicibacterium litorale]MCV7416873.1 hypothetical protein [Mycolicibacterium litorale]TDY04658.1 hypothetical protein BCL50_3433 [Mycolicibacterium litorale]BBY18084.1 hypothetical protein MLIT_36760 [Mycolicibacterium litorale]